MLSIFILFFLLTIVLNTLTTIPFSVAMLVVCTVIFRKSWVFFVAFGLGLFLDLFGLRSLAQTSLFFVLFVFIIWLYERKFETQTGTFVFISSFLASVVYLKIFEYNQILLQAFAISFIAFLLFKALGTFFKMNQES